MKEKKERSPKFEEEKILTTKQEEDGEFTWRGQEEYLEESW